MKASKFRPIGDNIVATMVDGYDEKITESGIIYKDKDGQAESIRARWFHVTHKGPDADPDVEVGVYALVKHGRWSRKFKIEDEELFKIEPVSILAVSDTLPTTDDIAPPGG